MVVEHMEDIFKSLFSLMAKIDGEDIKEEVTFLTSIVTSILHQKVKNVVLIDSIDKLYVENNALEENIDFFLDEKTTLISQMNEINDGFGG